MPLKLNVGLSKKVGQPNYGSIGASCHVEVELDSSLIQQDLDTFHRHVRNAFVACRQAVQDELAGHASADCSSQGNGDAGPKRADNSSTTRTNGNGREATASQLRALRAIAGRQRIDLAQEVSTRYGLKLPEQLSLGQASELIDELKAETNGARRRR